MIFGILNNDPLTIKLITKYLNLNGLITKEINVEKETVNFVASLFEIEPFDEVVFEKNVSENTYKKFVFDEEKIKETMIIKKFFAEYLVEKMLSSEDIKLITYGNAFIFNYLKRVFGDNFKIIQLGKYENPYITADRTLGSTEDIIALTSSISTNLREIPLKKEDIKEINENLLQMRNIQNTGLKLPDKNDIENVKEWLSYFINRFIRLKQEKKPYIFVMREFGIKDSELAPLTAAGVFLFNKAVEIFLRNNSVENLIPVDIEDSQWENIDNKVDFIVKMFKELPNIIFDAPYLNKIKDLYLRLSPRN